MNVYLGSSVHAFDFSIGYSKQDGQKENDSDDIAMGMQRKPARRNRAAPIPAPTLILICSPYSAMVICLFDSGVIDQGPSEPVWRR